MRKVVFLRISHSPLDGAHQTALVLQKTADGYLSVQGRAPVAWSERNRCWELFRKTAKSLLGVCETSVVSVCLSDPPHTAVSDLADVFRQPSHIVSLTLTPLHGRAEEMEMRNGSRAGDSGRNWDHHQQSLLAAPSGLYQPPRPSPLSSPGTKRRSAKLSGKEMDKLLAALEEVSQSLERTQTQCAAIARRCEEREREQAASGGEDTDYASDDTRVERLLKVADNLTTHIINHQQQQSPRRSPTPATTGTPRQPMMSLVGAGLPDSPTGVCVQPNLRGGIFVLWTPVRLDDRDRNNGSRVVGYAVYVNGVRRTKVDEPFASHTEIEGLENRIVYRIQVSTLTADGESPLSPPSQYRHEGQSSSSSSSSSCSAAASDSVSDGRSDSHTSKSAKVEDWLLKTSQISCPTTNHTQRAENKSLTTPPCSTHLLEDAWSMGSSHTSGIVSDQPPGSPKLTPSCPSCYHGDGFSVRSGTTVVDRQSSLPPYHHHHFSLSPSATPSRARSPASKGNLTEDTIDEPLDLTTFPSDKREERRAADTVQLVAGSRHRGPAPPGNVKVHSRQPGYITVTWTPTKRDGKGCSNGCFVLGYRVYVNGTSRISVDGPMSYETSIRWPHLDSTHKLAVHVRTRSIAAESGPSSTVVYDLILQESIPQYQGSKVNSAMSSSTLTLCPSDKPHPQSTNKSSPPRIHTLTPSTIPALSKETYV